MRVWGGEAGNLHFTFQSIIKIFSQDNSMFLEICKIDTHKHNKTRMGSKQYWIMWEMHIDLKVKTTPSFILEIYGEKPDFNFFLDYITRWYW